MSASEPNGVIASDAKQSNNVILSSPGLLRRCTSRNEGYWPKGVTRGTRFGAAALGNTSQSMDTKYYRYRLIPELEERGEVDAAKAISALCDSVDKLQAKVQAQFEQLKTLRHREA